MDAFLFKLVFRWEYLSMSSNFWSMSGPIWLQAADCGRGNKFESMCSTTQIQRTLSEHTDMVLDSPSNCRSSQESDWSSVGSALWIIWSNWSIFSCRTFKPWHFYESWTQFSNESIWHLWKEIVNSGSFISLSNFMFVYGCEGCVWSQMLWDICSLTSSM